MRTFGKMILACGLVGLLVAPAQAQRPAEAVVGEGVAALKVLAKHAQAQILHQRAVQLQVAAGGGAEEDDRAVELAQSTVGVNDTVDELGVAPNKSK